MLTVMYICVCVCLWVGNYVGMWGGFDNVASFHTTTHIHIFQKYVKFNVCLVIT